LSCFFTLYNLKIIRIVSNQSIGFFIWLSRCYFTNAMLLNHFLLALNGEGCPEVNMFSGINLNSFFCAKAPQRIKQHLLLLRNFNCSICKQTTVNLDCLPHLF
jgi:hypothetical protein